MADICFVDMAISLQENAFSAAISSTGSLFMWGPNKKGQLGVSDFQNRTLPNQVSHLKRKTIRSIALGKNFCLAIGKDVTDDEARRKKQSK